MLLQDLVEGEDLILQAKWGGLEYDLSSKVESVEGGGVYIKTYEYGGHVVDFGAPSFKGIVINVYVNNHNGKRYFWPDVSLKVVNKGNKSYYHLTTSAYKIFARESERRVKDRLLLEQNCMINLHGEDDYYHGIVRDISQVGLAFYCDRELDIDGKLVRIEFDDTVGGHEFKLEFKVRKVRTDDSGQSRLYGCRIAEASRDAMAYLYLKSLYMQKDAREQEQKLVAAETDNAQDTTPAV